MNAFLERTCYYKGHLWAKIQKIVFVPIFVKLIECCKTVKVLAKMDHPEESYDRSKMAPKKSKIFDISFSMFNSFDISQSEPTINISLKRVQFTDSIAHMA